MFNIEMPKVGQVTFILVALEYGVISWVFSVQWFEHFGVFETSYLY